MNMGTVVIFTLFCLPLCLVSEGCQRAHQQNFTTVLRGDTYTKGENSSLYYRSSGDTIRVDFHLPEGRPLTLDSVVVVPFGVGSLKIKFIYLSDTDIKSYMNPTSGEQLQAEVSTRVVSKLTLVAKATASSDVIMSMLVPNLTGCAWDCEKKEKDHFSVTQRGHTYTKTDNSMRYYSTGDTIRVDFYLPDERPITLQYMEMIPTNISVLKIKFVHLNNTKTLSYSNPASGELLRARVSHQVVSKLTVVARATESFRGDGDGDDAMSVLITNLTACHWVFESTTTPSNKTMTSPRPKFSEPRTSENYVTSTQTSLLPSNSSQVSNTTVTPNNNNNNSNNTNTDNTTTNENWTPDIWMYLNASNSSTLQQSSSTHSSHQQSTGKPAQTTAFAVENVTNVFASTSPRTKEDKDATSGGSVTSFPGLLENTDRNLQVEETEVEEEEEEKRIWDKPDTDLSRDSVIGIAGAVFAFLEVTITALVLFLQRHKLCSKQNARHRGIKKSRVSTIQQV